MDVAKALVAKFAPMIATAPVMTRAPVITLEELERVTVDARALFAVEPTLMALPSGIVVVGDIHGNLYDLYYVFQRCGMPPATRYLFLGDLVDRGEHSLSVIALVFALKVLYPDHMRVIRGNHECRSMTTTGGFHSDCETTFPKTGIYEAVIETFKYLPIAAVINGGVLCVHDGIVPEWMSLAQLVGVARPIECEEALIAGILWSDPSNDIRDYAISPRGVGSLYGAHVFAAFMASPLFGLQPWPSRAVPLDASIGRVKEFFTRKPVPEKEARIAKRGRR